MNHWMWLLSLVGILGTAVVLGTDMLCLTIGRAALRMASPSAGTEVMVFFHLFTDARMPIWGVSAILSNLLLVVLSRSGQRWLYLASRGSRPHKLARTRAGSSDSTSTGGSADSVVSGYGPIAVRLRAGSCRASVCSGTVQNTGRNRAASSLVAFADPVVSNAYAV